MTILRAIVRQVLRGPRLQRLQLAIRSLTDLQSVAHFQPFGLEVHPPLGSDALVTNVDGSIDNAVVIAVQDRQYAPGQDELLTGEVALYDAHGHAVKLLVTKVVILGTAVEIGTGGALVPITRQGDTVQVTIPPGTVDVGGVPNVVPIVLYGVTETGSTHVKAS